jgi:hypothetical protein
MKSYTLKANSWHLWLANWGHIRIRVEHGTDICSYIRAVIAGTFNMIGVSIIVGGLLGLIAFAEGSCLLWIYQCITGGFGEPSGPAIVGTFMNCVFLVTFVIHNFKEWWENREVKPNTEVEPGFIGLARQKFKNKTCFKIDFKE